MRSEWHASSACDSSRLGERYVARVNGGASAAAVGPVAAQQLARFRCTICPNRYVIEIMSVRQYVIVDILLGCFMRQVV